MNWRMLRRHQHEPVKLLADRTNATMPDSDWYVVFVNRASGYIVTENPATGYVIPLSRRELRGHVQTELGAFLELKVGLRFACPNAWFLYRDGTATRVGEAVHVSRWR